MDFLTHAATGLFLSRAGLYRFSPRATAIAVTAALAPDIDIVTAAGGSLNYLNYHRHWTHSFAAAPLLAFACVLAVRLAARKPLRWPGACGIAFLAVVSHLALDYTNLYGIRLLLPFSPEWLRADWTSVVDLWIWAVVAIALAGPFLARLVSAEIGAAPARRPSHGRGFAIFALVFLLAYNGGRALLHARAVAVLDSRLYQGAVPLRVAAFPNPANPLRWRGLVETSEFYSIHDVHLAADFDPTQGETLYKAEPNAAQAAAARIAVFRDFLRFAQFPLWRTGPLTDGQEEVVIEALDLRFGTPASPGFVARAILNARLQVARAWFTFGRARPR